MLSVKTVIAAKGIINQAGLLNPATIVRGDRNPLIFMRANGFLGIIDILAEKPDKVLKFAALMIPCDPAMAEASIREKRRRYFRLFRTNMAVRRQNFSLSLRRFPIRTFFQSFSTFFPPFLSATVS